MLLSKNIKFFFYIKSISFYVQRQNIVFIDFLGSESLIKYFFKISSNIKILTALIL